MGSLLRSIGRAVVSTCRDVWRCSPPPPAPRPPSLPYVCFQYHQVHVVWSRCVEQPSMVERLAMGIESGQTLEQCHHVLWPHERFARDDIDNHDVQKGYLRHSVGPVWRRYLPITECALVHGHGLVRITTAASIPDGFFIGFAPDLLTAMRWVATGQAPLFVPWSTPT